MTGTDSTKPSPAALRAELEALIVNELLGPVGGPNEALPGRDPVRDRYLVGLLAPRGMKAVDAERNDDAGAGGESGADSTAFADVAAQSVNAASSIGVSFSLLGSASSIVLDATWGRYVREVHDPQNPKDDGRVWQRYAMSGQVTVPLAEGAIGPLSLNANQPDVVIEGRCSKRGGAWFVSLFLVNGQSSVEKNKDEAWLFQPVLTIAVPGDAPLFIGRREAIDDIGVSPDPEDRALDLLYRDVVEFATGHNVSVHADVSTGDPRRATRITTVVVPRAEVAKVEAPTAKDDPALGAVKVGMEALSKLADTEFASALLPLAEAYDAWLDRQQARIDDPAERLDADARATAHQAVTIARGASARLQAGIELLGSDPVAADAFRFANEAMHRQRLHSLASSRRRRNTGLTLDEALAEVAAEETPSWRPFQLAFILVNLPSITDPKHSERTGAQALVDLLFFPTGGGKTEAYLGLTAYTLAIRRLQGVVGGFDGSGGVAVLMRYTLRLLTTQQFQRASALMCACEIARRERVADDPRWGTTPFRIGMWVGAAATPLTFDSAREVLDDIRKGNTGARAASPVQLVSCPWCGADIDPAKHAHSDTERWRTLVFCGDDKGKCAFTAKQSPGEGLPILTVDEEIYRLLPSMVIATVDKFAQLPWQGQLNTLFGRVSRRCSRHGYRSPDLDKVGQRSEADSHNAMGKLPKATTETVLPLRPPDLIIQDELHLISGPLGTLVGLYETAIDELATWECDGVRVRPKVVASTATVRRAREQTHELFWRDLAVFPPQVLDAGSSFFAVERDPAVSPGRRYLGICAPGARLKAVETRVFTAALAASKRLWDLHGAAADPWMTGVGYFMALRELGGMRRMVEDDISNRLRRTGRKGLGERRFMEVKELTSRIGSSDIPDILEQLSVPYKEKYEKGEPRSIDVLLATNMISVGVDVPRLGMMIAVGQPKTTAEYIQATSRVGRSTEGPGLVLTIYNSARPRDLSFYERFEHYHATFYRHVEALSVTPFSPRALDRGLTGVMVALGRHLYPDWNPNLAALDVDTTDPRFAAVKQLLGRRAEEVAVDPARRQLVEDMVQDRLDDWGAQRLKQKANAAGLSYRERSGSAKGLLQQPTQSEWTTWSCPTSLREVEANVNLIIDERDPSVDHLPAFGGPMKRGGAGGPSGDEVADDVADDELDDVMAAAEEAKS